MKVGEVKQRKIRSDKKREINLHLPTEFYDWFANIAYRSDSDLKPTIEAFAIEAVESLSAIEKFSNLFRREFEHADGVIFGDPKRKPFRLPRGQERMRTPIKLDSTTYEKYSKLAFALDCSIPTAVFITMYNACQDAELVKRVFDKLSEAPRRDRPKVNS